MGKNLYKTHISANLKKEVSNLVPLEVNLADWNATSGAIQSVYPIDLLVNNAGIGYIEPLTSITEDQYDKYCYYTELPNYFQVNLIYRMFGINVKATINVTKTVIENLLSRGVPGSIVSISSQASQAGLLYHTLYCASKGAIDAFTRAAALEFGPKKIRVNAVNPTVVMTEMGKKVWSDPAMGGPMLSKIPLNR